jgi:hypothetical protein
MRLGIMEMQKYTGEHMIDPDRSILLRSYSIRNGPEVVVEFHNDMVGELVLHAQNGLPFTLRVSTYLELANHIIMGLYQDLENR